MGEDSDVAVAQQQQEGEGDTKDKLESPKSSVKVVASSAAEDADKGTAAATTSGAGDAWDTNGADQTAAQVF